MKSYDLTKQRPSDKAIFAKLDRIAQSLEDLNIILLGLIERNQLNNIKPKGDQNVD